jgi:hypothetical protein
MHRRLRRITALLAVAAVAAVAGCTAAGTASVAPDPSDAGGAVPSASVPDGSAGSFSVLPVIVSSEQVVGTDRFLFSFLDAAANRPAGAPDRTASVSAYPSAVGPGAAVTGEGRFVWSIPDVVGYYVTTLAFDQPGEWVATFDTAAPGKPAESIGPFKFDVKADGSAIQVGEKAPSVKTPTLADAGGDVTKISTDKAPDPAFYETSLDAALSAGKPLVLVFATPAFCTSGACGPLLDTVKSVARSNPGLTFINVEPYQLETKDGRLQPVLDANAQLQTVPAVDAYGILSEPWLYVIDAGGTVTASIEGVVDETELRAAIEAVAGS